MESLTQASGQIYAYARLQIFFRTILCFVPLVYNRYFFQNSRFKEIIRHHILTQTLPFLTRLPTRQDVVENRDKVY